MLSLSKKFSSILVGALLLPSTLAFSGEPTGTTGSPLPAETEFNTNPTYLVISPRKNQSENMQGSDQLECFNWATDNAGWDPYLAYDELVRQGYALALNRQHMEEALVPVALEAAAVGEVAEIIAGNNNEGIDNGSVRAAAIGAAIGASLSTVDFSFLYEPDDPAAQRVVSRFERNLNKWEKKYSGCLKRKGYKVQSSDD